MAWNAGLQETQTANSARKLYLTQCATCHGDDLRGAPPQIPSLNELDGRRTAQEIAATIRDGGGRMPAFTSLRAADVAALSEYLLRVRNKELDVSALAVRGPR